MSRMLVGRVHLVGGLLAFALIATFWTSTVVSELFLGAAAVAAVKQAILWGMLLLIPAMVAVGGTGFRLGGNSKAPVIARKRRRMPVIALNGLLILAPSAFFLAGRAEAGQFDTAFYAVQAVELVAGAVNIALMSLNMRDGSAMTRKRRDSGTPVRPGPGPGDSAYTVFSIPPSTK
jgi:polyferredoxin